MGRLRVLPPLVALLLLAPLADATRVRLIADDETHTHPFPPPMPGPGCPEVIVELTASLTYAPPTDTLTLTVPGFGSVTGVNGQAELDFWLPTPCHDYTVIVEGTHVTLEAAYDLTVM